MGYIEGFQREIFSVLLVCIMIFVAALVGAFIIAWANKIRNGFWFLVFVSLLLVIAMGVKTYLVYDEATQDYPVLAEQKDSTIKYLDFVVSGNRDFFIPAFPYLAHSDGDSKTPSNIDSGKKVADKKLVAKKASVSPSNVNSDKSQSWYYPWWRYLLAFLYGLFIFWYTRKCIKKKKYWKAGIFLIITLIIFGFLKSWFFPNGFFSFSFLESVFDFIEKSFEFNEFIIGSLIGSLIVADWWWRHQTVKDPMDWNINPEASEGKRGPQKHWFGIWGNVLFHLNVFILAGPFFRLIWDIKVSFLWEALIILFYVFIQLSETEDDTSRFKKVYKSIRDWCVSPTFTGQFSIWRWNVFIPLVVINILRFVLVLAALIGLIVGSYVFDIPLSILIFSLLPLSFLIGGIYAPHIRGLIVPMSFKKPIYGTFLLMGREYIEGGGLKFTWIPSWRWGINLYLIDYSVWEVEEIQTNKIPTLGEEVNGKKKSGVILDLLLKITLQIFDPRAYLEMKQSDRNYDKIMDVVKRYVLDAVRDLAQQLTYEQIKLDKFFQFQVRYKDFLLMDKDHPLAIQYEKAALLWIKVKDEKSRKYLKPGGKEEGVFVKATFLEYVDYLLKTLTGTGVVEIGVMDVSSETIEKAEEALKVTEIEAAQALVKKTGEGAAEKAKMEKIQEGLDANPKAAEYLLQVKQAENVALAPLIEKFTKKTS